MNRRTWPLAMLIAIAGAGVLGAVWALTPPSSQPPASVPPTSVVPSADPIEWTGVAWQRVDDPFPVGDPQLLRVDGVTAGRGVLVGWGRIATPGRNQFNDMGGVVVSREGLVWRSIAVDDGVDAVDTSEVYGLAIGPAGMLAYGGVCCGTEELAMWRSVDGLTWSRARLGGDMAQGPSSVASVLGLETGWVAVGSVGDRAAIWTSGDGIAWQAVDPVAARLGKGNVSDVATTQDGVIAVGTVDDAAGTHDGAVWISKDGLSWTRTAERDPTLIGPDETELWNVVPFAAGIFVVGNFADHEERVRCEQLIGAMASTDGGPPQETALSCGWGREHHWLSSDGSSWVRLPPLDPLPGQIPLPGRRPTEFRLLNAGGPGLVNLAEDTIPPESDTRLWISADGITWQPVDPPFPAPVGTVRNGMVVVGRQVVAVGDGIGPGQAIGIAIGSVP